MKLTKRILCLAVAALLVCGLCACGNKQNDTPADNNTTTTTNVMGGNLEGDNTYNDGVFGEW